MNLALPRGTGVATYARTLTRCLKAMEHRVDVIYGMNISKRTPPLLREVMFFDSLDGDPDDRRPKPFSNRWWRERRSDWIGHEAFEVPVTGRVESRGFVHRMPAFDRILNVPGLFSAAARHYRRTRRFMTIRVPDPPRIMHWTYPLPIRLANARNIYTVHDLVPLRLPYTTLDDKRYFYRLMKELMRRADGICTVSESSRRDILAFYPEVEPRLVNTYQSVQPRLALSHAPSDVAAEIDSLFGLRPDGYFLFFGSFEPKKNVGRIIEGFLSARTSRPLVLVGAMAWKSENELRFLARGKQSGRILHIEYLPEPVLMNLIQAARAVLFPSLSEGFGLPVLEAMTFGTPVLTSREGSLPEVAADAALLVNAYDTDSIANGIAHLDGNDATCLKLRGLGPAQAGKFSMKAYEARVRMLYDTILDAPPRRH